MGYGYRQDSIGPIDDDENRDDCGWEAKCKSVSVSLGRSGVGVHSGESEWGNIGVVEKLALWAGLLGLIILQKSTFLGI